MELLVGLLILLGVTWLLVHALFAWRGVPDEMRRRADGTYEPTGQKQSEFFTALAVVMFLGAPVLFLMEGDWTTSLKLIVALVVWLVVLPSALIGAATAWKKARAR